MKATEFREKLSQRLKEHSIELGDVMLFDGAVGGELFYLGAKKFFNLKGMANAPDKAADEIIRQLTQVT